VRGLGTYALSGDLSPQPGALDAVPVRLEVLVVVGVVLGLGHLCGVLMGERKRKEGGGSWVSMPCVFVLDVPEELPAHNFSLPPSTRHAEHNAHFSSAQRLLPAPAPSACSAVSSAIKLSTCRAGGTLSNG
jgi:hypothetical protein